MVENQVRCIERLKSGEIREFYLSRSIASNRGFMHKYGYEIQDPKISINPVRLQASTEDVKTGDEDKSTMTFQGDLSKGLIQEPEIIDPEIIEQETVTKPEKGKPGRKKKDQS